jgi:hypothetical protein
MGESMKKLIPLLILLSTSAHAYNWFSYPMTGMWTQKDPKFGRKVHVTPSHLFFDDCGPVELIVYEFTDYYFPDNELTQRVYYMRLRAYYNYGGSCLKPGYHFCEAKVNQWADPGNDRYLMIQCDNWDFMRVYGKRIR